MKYIAFLDPILDAGFIQPILGYIYELEPGEIWIIIIALCVFVLFLTYRLFGIPAVAVLAVIFALAYILYITNISDKIKARDQNMDWYEAVLMEEIQKK